MKNNEYPYATHEFFSPAKVIFGNISAPLRIDMVDWIPTFECIRPQIGTPDVHPS
jgi:hypothetical protein